VEIGSWLVALDSGPIGRAKSAVPLRHDLGAELVGEVEDAYRARGLKPSFRLADIPSLEPIGAELARRGFAATQPTIFKIGRVSELAAVSDASATILSTPDQAWRAVFLGEGFDAIADARRIAALSRSPDAIYAAAGQEGQTHAVGVMSFGRGWAGIHGMRTAPGHRGKGYATAILGALGRAAQARGVERVSLQVEEGNPARKIYRRAGLSPAWRYHYWR
jgi:GNAT superfamily N-acetyltransferase